MKRIAIFQKDMGIGGIQRSLLNMITNMDLTSYEVDLFLFAEPEICTKDELKNINIHILRPLFYFNRLFSFSTLLKMYRYDLPEKEYDIAIDFNSYSNECALCTLAVNAKKRIMWIHNDIGIEFRNSLKYRILWTCFKEKYEYYIRQV